MYGNSSTSLFLIWQKMSFRISINVRRSDTYKIMCLNIYLLRKKGKKGEVEEEGRDWHTV